MTPEHQGRTQGEGMGFCGGLHSKVGATLIPGATKGQVTPLL